MSDPGLLAFRFSRVLTRSETRFSCQSLAKSGGNPDSTAAAFRELPFNRIYHNTAFAKEERDEIVACRHAEIIVPKRLDLAALRFVWCRSEAEKTTLLYHLTSDSKRRWAERIFQGRKYDLFLARWTFVERADLSQDYMTFYFNPSTATAGPFRLCVKIVTPRSSTPVVYEDQSFQANERLNLKFSETCSIYTVELRLDGSLAYRSEFTKSDLVF